MNPCNWCGQQFRRMVGSMQPHIANQIIISDETRKQFLIPVRLNTGYYHKDCLMQCIYGLEEPYVHDSKLNKKLADHLTNMFF